MENDHNYYIYYSKLKNYVSKMQDLEQIKKKKFQKMLNKENFATSAIKAIDLQEKHFLNHKRISHFLMRKGLLLCT
jgi:hypothetical protein